MADMVISAGIPDSQLYMQAVANVSAPFEVTPQSGNYPLVGNVLVNSIEVTFEFTIILLVWAFQFLCKNVLYSVISSSTYPT